MFTVCIICFRDFFLFFFFKDTATTEIYTYRHTLSLHDALPISRPGGGVAEHRVGARQGPAFGLFIKLHRGRDTDCRQELRSALKPHLAHGVIGPTTRSEEHTSELQSLMRISYAVFCLKKKKKRKSTHKKTIIIGTYHVNN